MACSVIPAATYAVVLTPLLKLGRIEEADAYQAKGYRMIRSNPDFLGDIADHIFYLTCTEKQTKAFKMFERHFEWAFNTTDLHERFVYYSSALPLFQNLVSRKSRKRKLKLPTDISIFQESGAYEVADVAAWLESEVQSLATKFNDRNGNTYYDELLEEDRKLARKFLN